MNTSKWLGNKLGGMVGARRNASPFKCAGKFAFLAACDFICPSFVRRAGHVQRDLVLVCNVGQALTTHTVMASAVGLELETSSEHGVNIIVKNIVPGGTQNVALADSVLVVVQSKESDLRLA
jgi:hypothetical protein